MQSKEQLVFNPTKKNLANHLNKPVQFLYYMEKNNPKVFNVLWFGWVEMCESNNKKDSQNGN